MKNVQKRDIINALLVAYRETPINRWGLELLYDRAASRGYMPMEIYTGLDIMICKNYVRDRYIPPHNDPTQEVIHERRYMEDWEFRGLFKGGSK